MQLGFIGLGNMGQPMGGRLIEAGHSLVVFDTDRAAVDALVRLGAQAASSPRDVADRVETVLASLPTPDVVLTVATGAGGVIEGGKVSCFVDLSTTGAGMARRVAVALAARNIEQVDCPVSGGVAGAQKGTLAVMASGPRARIERLHDVLSVFGRLFTIGEQAGAAQTMKLINNLLSATALAATTEAVAMGVKAGLDPAIMIDVINAGTGRNTASMDKFPKAILPGTYDAGFATGLMVKDVRLCLDEATALGLPMDVARAVATIWEITFSEIGPDKDFTTIMMTAEKRAGITLPVRKS